ncbi:hypothetical protein Thal_1057 [Thermocrinis albus DSM 14484]|uniref:Uncharacterized protein n=1 Tax=Thermocrinis albus (strain DSM 14484 / JCM 11386 / HI 11/12) TaxID=638303 RepID=D3SLQ9_THEAH|nr:hypothetical protein [Thermocrinis albus]ADC89689.1 hypothetical protein Thal_1057 [Thermocrinis albus DSM 14484]
MLKERRLILLVVRLLILSYFTVIALQKNIHTKAALLVIGSLYLSGILYSHLRFWKTGVLGRYMDLIFLIPMIYLSKEPISVVSLLLPMVHYVNRYVGVSLLALWSAAVMAVILSGVKGLEILPLLLGAFLSAYAPDLVESIRKERSYFVRLRKGFAHLTKELSSLDEERRRRKTLEDLFELFTKSDGVGDYIRSVKETFSLKGIRVVRGRTPSVEVDTANLSFSVPVGDQHTVIFYMNHPAQLRDRWLLENLERAARLLNLYIKDIHEGIVHLAV